MPAYNFQERFAPLVESGEKTHTIRKPRKRKTKVGELLKLYTGMRTRLCRLLRSAPCKKVVPILIEHDSVELEGQTLVGDELDLFAQSDGFKDGADFFKFWCDTYGLSEENPQEMEVIYW